MTRTDRVGHHGRVETTVIDVLTGSRTVTDITPEVLSFCQGKGDGACLVFVPHATAGAAIIEVGSGTEADLELTLEAALPRDAAYRHRHGSPGHGRDHVLPALVSPSILLPVLAGRPALGTWQSVVLVDTNADNPRRHVRLSFLPG